MVGIAARGRALAGRLGLGLGEPSAPAITLTSRLRGPAEAVGEAHVARSPGPVSAIITLRLGIPALGLGIERLWAFTDEDGPLPHLFVGVSRSQPPGTPGLVAVDVDLLPRVDLAVNLAYAAAIYGPLAPAFEAALAHEEARERLAGPLRRALGSPAAALVHFAGEAGEAGAAELVDAYVGRWVALVREGPGAAALAGLHAPAAAARDRRLRAALVDPRVDRLWGELGRLCEAEGVAALAGLVTGAGA